MFSLTRGALSSAAVAGRASTPSTTALRSAFAVRKNSLNFVAASASSSSSASAFATQRTASPTSSLSRQARERVPITVSRAFSSSHIRWAANPQAGKPTSDNVGHMVKNIKEEVNQVASSISSTIAGAPGSGDLKRSGGGEILSDAKTITSEMTKAMPQPALLWGAAGVVPYITTAGASIYLARQTWLVANGIDTHLDLDTAQALLLHAQNIQITYGAVLLSFLGAIHWGFEFSKYGGVIGNRRYIIGLVPFVIGWPTLLLTPNLALISQWSAFVVAWFVDLQATNAGWVPKWYSTYRFWLSVCVGVSILATLAGTSWYSTDAAASGRRSASAKLLDSKKDSIKRGDKVQKAVSGDIEASPAGESGDGYVQFTNVKKHEEEEAERKKKEQEKEKAKDKQAAKQEEKLSKQMEQADSKDA
ncbi:hypothetical protein OC845_003332 [Tilletia horrida]|nr:hypothetical protein OC845_003332 [Tilletia horrida]